MASNDPFRPLLSLADQKTLNVSEKLAEKKDKLAASPLATDTEQARAALQSSQGTLGDLADIGQSSIRQGNEVLFDAIHGETRTGEDIRQLGDITSGVTPEARQRLVTGPQEEVIQSLAAGNYLDALVGSVKAAPGTLADSANVIPEIAAGAALTIAGGSGIPALLSRGKKLVEGPGKIIDRVGKAKKNLNKTKNRLEAIKQAALTIPRTAGQMSVVTADITQRQIADFEQEHGERPSAERIAGMYATNLATMTAEGGIIKNLFIPDFKKEFVKEAKSVVKNMRKGSNLVNMGVRVADGMKKVLVAGGAEAAQEYAQTWADIINVGVGPNEDFIKGMTRELKGADNQLEALAGSFLGFGAGGLARGVIAAPAVATGTAIDATKATVKGTVKTTAAVTKKVAQGVQAVANEASFKVLSQEERDTIKGEFASRKKVVDQKVAEFQSAVDQVKKATSISELRKNSDERTAGVIEGAQKDLELTDSDLGNRRTLERLKAKVIRSFRGDIGLLKTELEASNIATIAKRTSKNIQTKSVQAAVEVVAAVSPGVKAVVQSVEKHGKQAVKAVKELRSSTALGMVELAANAGKKEIKQIVTAAKSLSRDDLQRATAVIGQINPEIGRQLQKVQKAKDKALKRTGQLRDTIINNETLSPIIADVAKRANIAAGEIAAVSSALNETVAGKISDLEALAKSEAVVAAIEKSADFKNQVEGAITKAGLDVVKRKLETTRKRLEGKPKKVKDKVKKKVDEAVEAATPVVKGAVDKVKKAVKDVNTVKITGTFRAVVEAVGETIKDPKQAQPLVDGAGDFIKQMRKFGVETRAQFENFIEEFPEMQNNVEFFKKLDEAYPSTISANEAFDIVKTAAVDSVAKIKEAYNKMNPSECKV